MYDLLIFPSVAIQNDINGMVWQVRSYSTVKFHPLNYIEKCTKKWIIMGKKFNYSNSLK